MRVTTAVAKWEGGNDGNDIVALLALCSRITARFTEQRLLIPSSIDVGDWVGGDQATPPTSVHLTLAGTATSVVIHGTGEIDLPAGERRTVEDLVVCAAH